MQNPTLRNRPQPRGSAITFKKNSPNASRFTSYKFVKAKRIGPRDLRRHHKRTVQVAFSSPSNFWSLRFHKHGGKRARTMFASKPAKPWIESRLGGPTSLLHDRLAGTPVDMSAGLSPAALLNGWVPGGIPAGYPAKRSQRPPLVNLSGFHDPNYQHLRGKWVYRDRSCVLHFPRPSNQFGGLTLHVWDSKWPVMPPSRTKNRLEARLGSGSPLQSGPSTCHAPRTHTERLGGRGAVVGELRHGGLAAGGVLRRSQGHGTRGPSELGVTRLKTSQS